MITNEWNYDETKLTIYFGDLPLNTELELILTNWYAELKNVPSQRQAIEVSGYFRNPIELLTGVKVREGQKHTISFWYSIYDKWKFAPKNTALNTQQSVILKLKRLSAKKWYIISIRNHEVS